MTRKEIVKEALRLPLADRKAAVEEITSSIREELNAGPSDTREGHATSESSFDEKRAAFFRLEGMLKTGTATYRRRVEEGLH